MGFGGVNNFLKKFVIFSQKVVMTIKTCDGHKLTHRHSRPSKAPIARATMELPGYSAYTRPSGRAEALGGRFR